MLASPFFQTGFSAETGPTCGQAGPAVLRRINDPKLAKEFLKSAHEVKGLKAEKCNFELPNNMIQAFTSYRSDHKQVDILSFGLHLFLLCVALVIWKFTFFPASLLPASRFLRLT